MCLDITAFTFKKSAKKDIHCWKILLRDDSERIIDTNTKQPIIDSTYLTPYKYADVEIGEPMESKLFRAKTGLLKWSNKVEMGIHSFLEYYDARLVASHIYMDLRRKELQVRAANGTAGKTLGDDYRVKPKLAVEVCPAIIPKGAKYYQGTFGNIELDSYASTSLIVTETE